ncbi:hypothetical protein P0N62_10645 [Limosilactobacillus fermentum]|uniref:mucin-binding protein n=1 Tax=Limosilactobacillus fermentum TaxID=1613 RepID=UPI002165E939|nr:hypothetical protein [Limosilactobacillus fermentum]UVW03054.1 hypothetical protein NX839_07890 [Limosilactobacillus fermentum]WEN05521.1 hypothetical protein P0M30_10635 [Limosilactobacillus fermentum]WEN12375.1 hypothetical protein P0N62_10645 [Limosilactobacillus fermentum]WJD39029.1 hypothetical protein QRA02_10645 [Limosilactobacillus fermentum]
MTTGSIKLSVNNKPSGTSTWGKTVVNLANTTNGDAFNVYLTGPVTSSDIVNTGSGTVKVLYSTSTVSASDLTEDSDTDGFVTADQITDWSTVRAVMLMSADVNGNSQIQVTLPIKVTGSGTDGAFVADDNNKTVYMTVIQLANHDQTTYNDPESGEAASTNVIAAQLIHDTNVTDKTADADAKTTITRTVNVTEPGQTTPTTTTQSATFSQPGTQNLATGEISYGAGTVTSRTGNNVSQNSSGTAVTFGNDGISIPVVAGYTPTITMTTTAADGTQTTTTLTATLNSDGTAYTFDVTYTANAQSFNVTYYDETTGETLTTHGFTLSGVTGGSYASQLAANEWDYAAAGYVLDTDQNATDPLTGLSGTFGATNSDVTVYLKHGVTAGTQTGASTFTVNYTGAVTNPTSKVQTIDYTRTMTTDNVTGAVTYGAWTVTGDTNIFTAVTTPTSPTNESVAVSYSPVGTVTITNPDGSATTTAYSNDQSDATKVTSFSVPSIAGYTATVTGATEQTDGTYLPDSATQNSTITYVANAQTNTYQLLDPDTKAVIGTVTSTGVTDGTVDPSDPKSAGDAIDGSTDTYQGGVSQTDLNKTVTRTLQLDKYPTYNSDGTVSYSTKTVAQAVSFDRTATVDAVTGEVLSYSDWANADSTTTFPVYVLGVDGYIVSAMNRATLSTQTTFVIGEDGTTRKTVEIVPAETPTANEKDYTWEYVYSPKAQSFTVTYVDDTTDTTLTDHGFTLTGVTTGSYADQLASDKWDYAAAGYVLDTDKNTTDPLVALSGTFGATNNNVVVYLKHGTKQVAETGTATYTVAYTGAGSDTSSQPQTIDYTRTNTVDAVTGDVTAYGDWSVTGDTTSFTSVTTPVKTGYVADKASLTVEDATPTTETDMVTYLPVGTVTITKPDGTSTTTPYSNDQSDATKVTSFSVPSVAGYTAKVTGATKQADGTYLPDDATANTTVTYVADPQSIAVTYVDETTGQPITAKSFILTGVTDGSYANQLASDKWDFAADGYALDTAKNGSDPLTTLSGTFGATNGNVTVYLVHQTKTVTRTINITNPVTGETTTTTQVAHFTRAGTKDEVTGEVTYGAWTSLDNSFSALSVPEVAGYTASQTTVPAETVSASDDDSTVNVTYTADPQNITVTYVDAETGRAVKSFTLTGTTGSSYASQLADEAWDYAAAGYKLDTAKNATDPLSELSGTFGAQNAGVTVYLTHQTSTTTQIQTITRIINYLDPTTKELTSLTQTAELTRTVEEDLVTGAKTYSQWTTATWPSFTVPSVAGYTASPTVVPALVVKDGDGDVTVTIAYTKLVPNSSAASSSPASAASASATPNSASAGFSAANAATNSASAVSAAPAAVTNTAPTSRPH